jgi:hypothetical protein
MKTNLNLTDDKTGIKYRQIIDDDPVIPLILEENIKYLKYWYKLDIENLSSYKKLKVTYCNFCKTIPIIDYRIRKYCSDKCRTDGNSNDPNNEKNRRKVISKQTGKHLTARYRPDATGDLKYTNWSNKNKIEYTIPLDKLLQMDNSERTKLGLQQIKFYGLKTVNPNEWNDEKIDELIDEIFTYCSQNETTYYSPLNYFIDNKFYPQTVKKLRELSDKFNEFYESMIEYNEQVLVNKSLTSEINTNFSIFYLNKKHGYEREKLENQNNIPMIQINYPSIDAKLIDSSKHLQDINDTRLENTPFHSKNLPPTTPTTLPGSTISNDAGTNTPENIDDINDPNEPPF